MKTEKGIGKTRSSIDTLGSMYSYSLLKGRGKRTSDSHGDMAESEPFLANGFLPAPLFVSSRSLLNPNSEHAVVLPRSSDLTD